MTVSVSEAMNYYYAYDNSHKNLLEIGYYYHNCLININLMHCHV